MALRKALWALGVRYRKNFRTPGGRADIALPAKRIAVFVDGCFWHGCPEHYVRPRTRNNFWDQKLSENVERDRRQTLRLLEHGWTSVRLWEHEIGEELTAATAKLLRVLHSGRPSEWPQWRVVLVEPVDANSTVERRYLEELLGPGRRLEESPRMTAKRGRVARTSVAVSVEQARHKRCDLRRQ